MITQTCSVVQDHLKAEIIEYNEGRVIKQGYNVDPILQKVIDEKYLRERQIQIRFYRKEIAKRIEILRIPKGYLLKMGSHNFPLHIELPNNFSKENKIAEPFLSKLAEWFVDFGYDLILNGKPPIQALADGVRQILLK